MATSGALSTDNSNIKYKITITQNSQNVSGNTSNVTVSVRFYRTNTGYTTYGTGTVYCKINGTTYSASVTSDDKITSGGIVLFTRTLTIAHNADGTKTLNTSAWIDHSQVSSSEQSYNQALTTIPRATTPSVNDSDLNLGESVTISTPRASSAFTHTLKYSFGGASGTIATGVTTSKAWTIPLSLATNIPNVTSGKLTISCETYNGNTKIGTKSVTITVRVPASVVPTISSVAVTDTNSTQYTKMGGVVKGKSSLSVVITASGAQGSTISSYSTTAGGKSYAGAKFTVSSITTAGTLTFSVTVKDSRGRTATATKSITVVDYANPVIDKLSVTRANADGTPNDEGTSLFIEYGFTIASVNSKNDKSYKLEIKAPEASGYTTVASGSVYSLDTNVIVTEDISVDSSYSVRLTISDYFRSLTHTVEAPTAFTLMDFHSSGKGIAFGKVAQKEGVIDMGLPVEFSNGEVPAGAIPILSGTDIDTLLDPGYYVFSSAVSTTLINLPFTASGSGSIEVIREGEANQIRQVITRCSANREIWERLYYSNKFQSTQLIYKGGNRVLWSGGMYMTSGHVIAFSELASKQPNGIVLVFSEYYDGEAKNQSFFSFFVHKDTITSHSGTGHCFFMCTSNVAYCATKYLYIRDDGITGHNNNNLTLTGSGLTLNNNRFVLRYVIGV